MDENLKIIIGGMLIDGVKKEPLKNPVIIIEGDKIIDVGTKESVDIPKGELIDAKI